MSAPASFNALLKELLDRKSGDISESRLRQLIDEKKAKVGAGYLTDKGALFLVAADLGVKVSYKDEGGEDSLLPLADLRQGQRNVQVHSRLLSAGPPRSFVRKSDGSTGLRSKAIVFDESATLTATLWDRKAAEFALDQKVAPGAALRISNATINQGLEGLPTLNIGEEATIEILKDGGNGIPQLDSKILSPKSITEGEKRNIAITGRVRGEVKTSDFFRKDGTSGLLHSFELSDGETKAIRVVVWENDDPVFSKLVPDEKITLLNVRSRRYEHGRSDSPSIELHGDESTRILEKWEQSKSWFKVLSERSKNSLSLKVSGVTKVGPPKPLPFIGRLISINRSAAEETVHALLIDSRKRRISLSIRGEARADLQELNEDDVIICKPESFDEPGLKATLSHRGSVSRVKPPREDIPHAASLVSRIDRLESGSIVSIEVMSLSSPIKREITTKEGIIARTELSVADPTGDIKLYGWRNLGGWLEGIAVGEKMWLNAVEVQSYEGRRFLNLKSYSTVQRSPEN